MNERKKKYENLNWIPKRHKKKRNANCSCALLNKLVFYVRKKNRV